MINGYVVKTVSSLALGKGLRQRSGEGLFTFYFIYFSLWLAFYTRTLHYDDDKNIQFLDKQTKKPSMCTVLYHSGSLFPSIIRPLILVA